MNYLIIKYLAFYFFLINCNNDKDELLPILYGIILQNSINQEETIKVDENIKEHKVTFIVTLKDKDGKEFNQTLNSILYFPNASSIQSSNAIVIMHGSGGLWSNQNPSLGLAKQFTSWKQLLTDRGYIVLFIDSYQPRGVASNSGDYRFPPGNSVIAAEYVRNRDAYAGLNYLTKLIGNSNQRLVNSEKVGLLGFSHGGTTVIATLADTNAATVVNKTVWMQSYDGKDYLVPNPKNIQSKHEFKLGVSFYPGVGMYSYYGNYGKEYINKKPILLIAAENDPLYFNNENLYNKFINNVAANNLNHGITMRVYNGANHSFDEKEEGVDGAASSDARTTVFKYLEDYL